MRRLSLSLVMLLVLSLLMVFEVRHVSASSPPPDSIRYSDSVYYVKGRSFSGTHLDTHSNDTTYHVSKGDRTNDVPQRMLSDGGGGFILNVRYKFTTGNLTKNQISKIEVEAYAHTDQNSSEYGVWLDIYNYRTVGWENIGFFYGNTSDQLITWVNATVPVNYTADYVDDVGNMELKWFFWASDISKLSINFQCLKLTLRTWTFMVYMASDEWFLGGWAKGWNFTINTMENSSVSTSDVAVIVQFDNYTESPSGVRRYLILKDNNVENITSPILWFQDEVNMGDPSTLVDFVNWSIQRYPAKHYALVFWNHGYGFRGVCDDENPADRLNMTELKQALNDMGVTFDLIGFDACVMGQLEVAYQIKEYAQVMIGYEARGDLYFLPYGVTFMNLTDDPMMSVVELGMNFVTNFANYRLANPSPNTTFQTISAVHLANITELASRVSDLAIELQQNLEAIRDNITQSRINVEEYAEQEDRDYVDIYHLAQLLKQNINNTTVENLCQQVKQALNATIISEWHYPDGIHPDSHGLSLYFPDELGDYEAQYDYIGFTNCTQWDEFLKAYLGI